MNINPGFRPYRRGMAPTAEHDMRSAITSINKYQSLMDDEATYTLAAWSYQWQGELHEEANRVVRKNRIVTYEDMPK
ncbi:hypothetical protein CTA1_12997 [Colletotrichum tanaceti]|uniref:Uncharacterized protein n=1 Tax=Colletotrichum tanaceti TaxID=1306861 RepID=A0A4U6XAF3_9PEZI|nr:hypothetical protein CTA1_12997 [Colletotrichum tanaceti]